MPSIFTSPRTPSCLALAALATAAAMSLPTVSVAQPDSGYTTYRCVVLGESQACPVVAPTPANRVEVDIVAGPYAQYLMHLGQDAETALDTAEARGEMAVKRTVQVSTRSLSADELREKQLGHLATPATSYRILAELPVDAETALACTETACKPGL